MKPIKPFLLALPFFLCLSCAFHNGIMTTSAALSHANFTVVRMVSASARASYFLGIGGLEPEGLMLEAKKELYSRYPLKKGQAYANMSVDYKTSWYILYVETLATITADIVDFNEVPERTDGSEEVPGTESKKTVSAPTRVLNKAADFSESETVKYAVNGYYKTGKILELKNKTVTVSDFETTSTYVKSRRKIYKMENTGSLGKSHNLSVGDPVKIKRIDNEVNGTVLALAEESFLVTFEGTVGSRIVAIRYDSSNYEKVSK